jgi:hypothetical protein
MKTKRRRTRHWSNKYKKVSIVKDPKVSHKNNIVNMEEIKLVKKINKNYNYYYYFCKNFKNYI